MHLLDHFLSEDVKCFDIDTEANRAERPNVEPGGNLELQTLERKLLKDDLDSILFDCHRRRSGSEMSHSRNGQMGGDSKVIKSHHFEKKKPTSELNPTDSRTWGCFCPLSLRFQGACDNPCSAQKAKEFEPSKVGKSQSGKRSGLGFLKAFRNALALLGRIAHGATPLACFALES